VEVLSYIGRNDINIDAGFNDDEGADMIDTTKLMPTRVLIATAATVALIAAGTTAASAATPRANDQTVTLSSAQLDVITSGAIAAGLFATAGILSACNWNGRGAQLNYNWVTWTCWAL
jgi:hypothetical protein